MSEPPVILPHSSEAEMAVLCSILLKPKESIEICEAAGVDEEWYYIPKNGWIYRVMERLWKRDKALHLIQLTEAIAALKKLDKVGGPSYLAELQDFIATAAMLETYLELLRGYKLQRQLWKIGHEAKKIGIEPMEPEKAEQEIIKLKGRITAITETKTGECTKHAFELAKQAIHKRRVGLTEPLGMPTGITKWDERLKGLHPTVMYVLASRPGIGKTSMMEKMIERTIACERHCLVVQKDMSIATMIGRMAARRAEINYQRFFQGTMTPEEMDAYEAEVLWLEERQEFMHMYNTTGMTGAQYAALIRTHKEKHDIRSSFLDHFLLLRHGERDSVMGFAMNSIEIRQAITETETAGVILVHVNREGGNKARPSANDIKYCDQLYSDTDILAILFSEVDPKTLTTGEKQPIIMAIEKNRIGNPCDITLQFDRTTTTFE